jgi:hypothetical protein
MRDKCIDLVSLARARGDTDRAGTQSLGRCERESHLINCAIPFCRIVGGKAATTVGTDISDSNAIMLTKTFQFVDAIIVINNRKMWHAGEQVDLLKPGLANHI